jgi:serine/threonine protein kinase
MKIPTVELESQFKVLLSRLGSRLGARYHVDPERIEDKYALTDIILGRGSCGIVRVAHGCGNLSHTFAVKTVDFDTLHGFNDWKMLERQLEVSLMVDHPNLVGVVDVYETTRSLHFVMPHMKGGQLVKDKDAPPLSEDTVRDLAKQMLVSLSYMHRSGMVHRDIKPANFVSEGDIGSGSLKLLDFDMSALWKPGDSKMITCCGTPGFMSPELILMKGYTSKTDVWSLGVTLYAILVGELPFDPDEAPSQETVDELLKSRGCDADISPAALHFIGRLLKVNPNERLDADEALCHPFLGLAKKRELLLGSGNKQCNQGRNYMQAFRHRQRRGTKKLRHVKKECDAWQRMNPCANVQVDILKALDAYDRKYCSSVQPATPRQHKLAKVCWADLEDDIDEAAPGMHVFSDFE